MPPLTDPAQIEYLTGLYQLELDGARRAVTMGPFTMFALTAAVQLAMRHPEISPFQAWVLRGITDDMRASFEGTPAGLALALGGDPAQDWPAGRGRSLPASASPFADWALVGLSPPVADGGVTAEVSIIGPGEAHPQHRVGLTTALSTGTAVLARLSPGNAERLAFTLRVAAAETLRRDADHADTVAEAARPRAADAPGDAQG